MSKGKVWYATKHKKIFITYLFITVYKLTYLSIKVNYEISTIKKDVRVHACVSYLACLAGLTGCFVSLLT